MIDAISNYNTISIEYFLIYSDCCLEQDTILFIRSCQPFCWISSVKTGWNLLTKLGDVSEVRFALSLPSITHFSMYISNVLNCLHIYKLQTVFLLGLIGFCGLNHCNGNYTQSNDYGIKDHDFWIREKIFILRYTKTFQLNLKFRYITKYVRDITVSDVNLWMNPWYLLIFYLSTKSTGLQKGSSW